MDLKAVLEGLLFVAGDDGLTVNQMLSVLDVDKEELNNLITILGEEYKSSNRGISLEYFGGKLKMVTKKEHAEYYKKLFSDEDSNTLSPSALETLAIIAYNKAQAMDLLKGELNNGVFRRSSSSFLAHYLIICDESNNWKVKISAIDNGVVKHTEYPMIIDTTNDENAVLTLGSNVTVDGISLNKLYYNYLNGEIETDNANVVCDTRKASDIAAWYADGWKTHIVDQDEIHADFKGIFHSGVEFDDRNPRNLIACPWSGMGSYIGFAVTMTADNATGRIFISLGEPYDLFGWNNNPADYNRVQQDYSKFLSFCVSEDGFYWSYDDNDSMVYVLSATGERWFRMKK